MIKLLVKYSGIVVLGGGVAYGLFRLIKWAIMWIKNYFEL